MHAIVGISANGCTVHLLLQIFQIAADNHANVIRSPFGICSDMLKCDMGSLAMALLQISYIA